MVIMVAILCVGFLFASGCAHQADKAALGFEKALTAGSAAVDVYVDETIEKCRAQELPTVEQRAKCVEKAEKVSDATEKAMVLAVEGLRVYWSARAQDNPAAMLYGMDLIRQAAAMLPGDFFAGLKGLK